MRLISVTQQNVTLGRFSDLSEPHICHLYTRDDDTNPRATGRIPRDHAGRPSPELGTRVSLAAQMVKNLPATQETWVQFLGQEDALEKGMATHSSILARRIPDKTGAWRATVNGVTKESDMTE